MKRTARIALQVVILSIFTSLISCAIVTVNIYFPAEEVKDAYISLEEELLRTPEDVPETEKTPGQANPQGQPQSLRKYPDRPQLESRRFIVLKRKFDIQLGSLAWAQGDIAQQITSELRRMPQVMKAFSNRRGRLASINNMLSQGKVGEGNKGLLVTRGTLSGKERADFTAENNDRQTIIRGMAEAIVRINNLDPTPDNVNRVLPQAAEQFAAARREEAKSGWEIQRPDGSWTTR